MNQTGVSRRILKLVRRTNDRVTGHSRVSVLVLLVLSLTIPVKGDVAFVVEVSGHRFLYLQKGDWVRIQDGWAFISIKRPDLGYLPSWFSGRPGLPLPVYRHVYEDETHKANVHIKITTADLGESRQMFGYPARRVRYEARVERSICEETKGRFEKLEGWAIDLPGEDMQRTQLAPTNANCKAILKIERIGPQIGVIIEGWGSDSMSSGSFRTVGLWADPLDPALFDPATALSTPLPSSVTKAFPSFSINKIPGAKRLCLALERPRSRPSSTSLQALTVVTQKLQDASIDARYLMASNESELFERAAPEQQCDQLILIGDPPLKGKPIWHLWVVDSPQSRSKRELSVTAPNNIERRIEELAEAAAKAIQKGI